MECLDGTLIRSEKHHQPPHETIKHRVSRPALREKGAAAHSADLAGGGIGHLCGMHRRSARGVESGGCRVRRKSLTGATKV